MAGRPRRRARREREARQNASAAWKEQHKEAISAFGKRQEHLFGHEGIPVEDRDLSGLDLQGAMAPLRLNLYRVILHGADLSGANLEGADLYGANLRGANLRGATLMRADLIGADLDEADLRDADLEGATLYGADLRGADLRGATGLTPEQIAYAKSRGAII